MTNHWNDIANSDAILIMGSNAAENHPIGFKYVTKAMEKGATLISVDPRFTRTSSKADIYAQVRPGLLSWVAWSSMFSTTTCGTMTM